MSQRRRSLHQALEDIPTIQLPISTDWLTVRKNEAFRAHACAQFQAVQLQDGVDAGIRGNMKEGMLCMTVVAARLWFSQAVSVVCC